MTEPFLPPELLYERRWPSLHARLSTLIPSNPHPSLTLPLVATAGAQIRYATALAHAAENDAPKMFR